MSNDTITLYDLPSRHKGDDHLTCFSFNPWKTRMALNYKKITYTTEWTEYPDLAPKMKAMGVPPNDPGTAFAEYSSPTVRLPDGMIVMNSIKIVHELEKRYPEPSLHVDTDVLPAVIQALDTFAMVIWWDALAATPKDILTSGSAAYFAESRKKALGASLDEIAAEKGGEKAWEAVSVPGGPLDKLKDELTKHRKDSGPFVLGSEVSYGDFVVVGVFECLERCHLKSYERLMELDDEKKTLKNLHEACRPWLERDN